MILEISTKIFICITNKSQFRRKYTNVNSFNIACCTIYIMLTEATRKMPLTPHSHLNSAITAQYKLGFFPFSLHFFTWAFQDLQASDEKEKKIFIDIILRISKSSDKP